MNVLNEAMRTKSGEAPPPAGANTRILGNPLACLGTSTCGLSSHDRVIVQIENLGKGLRHFADQLVVFGAQHADLSRVPPDVAKELFAEASETVDTIKQKLSDILVLMPKSRIDFNDGNVFRLFVTLGNELSEVEAKLRGISDDAAYAITQERSKSIQRVELWDQRVGRRGLTPDPESIVIGLVIDGINLAYRTLVPRPQRFDDSPTFKHLSGLRENLEKIADKVAPLSNFVSSEIRNSKDGFVSTLAQLRGEPLVDFIYERLVQVACQVAGLPQARGWQIISLSDVPRERGQFGLETAISVLTNPDLHKPEELTALIARLIGALEQPSAEIARASGDGSRAGVITLLKERAQSAHSDFNRGESERFLKWIMETREQLTTRAERLKGLGPCALNAA